MQSHIDRERPGEVFSISVERNVDKLMQHGEIVNTFDRNGHGFELEKGQQTRKAENEVKSQDCKWCRYRGNTQGLRKIRIAKINFFAIIHNNIYIFY